MQDKNCRHILFGGDISPENIRNHMNLDARKQVKRRVTLLRGPCYRVDPEELDRGTFSYCPPGLFRNTPLDSENSRIQSPGTDEANQIFSNKAFPKLHRAQSENDNHTASSSSSSTKKANIGTKMAHSKWSEGRPLSLRRDLPDCDDTNGFRKYRPKKVVAEFDSLSKSPERSQSIHIDPPLHCDEDVFQRIKSAKYCSRYHIRGEDACTFSDCPYRHGPPLEGQELIALRKVTRFVPCYRGLSCKDEKCINGHQCPHQPCRNPKCKFSRAAHRYPQEAYESRVRREVVEDGPIDGDEEDDVLIEFD